MIHWPSLGKALFDIVKWTLVILFTVAVIVGIIVLSTNHVNILIGSVFIGLYGLIIWARYKDYANEVPLEKRK